MVLKQYNVFNSFLRRISTKPTTNVEIRPKIINRNPRNLERLRLQRKPVGYGVDMHNVEYWHKLVYNVHNSCVSAQIVHNSGQIVVHASTTEWAFRKQLYSLKDKQAHIALATVFAERCFESGIYSCACFIKATDTETNVYKFLKVLEQEGLTLTEPECFNIYDIWRKPREKRPWTVLED